MTLSEVERMDAATLTPAQDMFGDLDRIVKS